MAERGGQYAPAAGSDRPDPARALVLGNVAHNLSASGDHALFRLSATPVGRPLPERECRTIACPFHVDAEELAKDGSPERKFLPPPLQAGRAQWVGS